MSTYSIAGAIEKFAKDFKEVVSEKNKIEREKLEFEKEKFEFHKQKLQLKEGNVSKECEHDWEAVNFTMTNDDIILHYKCRKCNANKDESIKQLSENVEILTDAKEKECEHKWESFIVVDQGGLRRRTEYRCSKCGTLKT